MAVPDTLSFTCYNLEVILLIMISRVFPLTGQNRVIVFVVRDRKGRHLQQKRDGTAAKIH